MAEVGPPLDPVNSILNSIGSTLSSAARSRRYGWNTIGATSGEMRIVFVKDTTWDSRDHVTGLAAKLKRDVARDYRRTHHPRMRA